MFNIIKPVVITAALISMLGCNFLSNPSFNAKDGNPEAVTSELSDMGNSAGELFSGTYSRADTVTGNITIEKWHFDSTAKSWLRKVEGSDSNGNSYTRTDTVVFFDLTGDTLTSLPTVKTVSRYVHVRNAGGVYNQKIYSMNYNMSVTLEKQNSDTTFVFNGSFTGNYDGTTFNNTSVTNVKRKLNRTLYTHLDFPSEGNIYIERIARTIDITFGENSTATVTVTRKSDDKTWIYTINVN